MGQRPSLHDVLKGLQAEGLVPPDAEERARTTMEVYRRNDVATPWFVKALAGFGAWVAASFLLSFFGCVGILKEEALMAVIGLGLCGGATALRRAAQGAFVEQLTLALCLAGVVMVSLGIGEMTHTEEAVAWVNLVLGAVLLAWFPDATLRFLMAGVMVSSAVFLLWEGLGFLGVQLGLLGCTVAVHVLLLEQARLRRGRWGELVGPVAYSLAVCVMGALLTFHFAHEWVVGLLTQHGVSTPDALLTLGLTALTLYTAWRVTQELRLESSGVTGAAVFVALAVLALMTLHTPAIITAVGLMVLAFHRRAPVLLGLAVAFLLASGAWYYYDLALTLLAKALALTGSGLLFLGLRLFLLRRFPAAVAEVR